MAESAKRPKRRLFDSFQSPKKKNHVAVTVTDHANAHLNTTCEPESQSHTKTGNASKSQDVNADSSKKKKKKKKKTINTHQPQPQPQADDVDPSASQGINDTPAAGNVDIILQSLADRMDREGIYLELLHRDVVANLVELWRLFKDAELKCKLQEAHFREELFKAIVMSSSHTS